MQNKDVNTLTKLNNRVGELLAKKGAYFSRKLFALKKQAGYFDILNNEKAPSKPVWLIIGKEHYFETTKTYPIANIKELKNAIKFDVDVVPESGITLYKITKLNENSHKVTFWTFDNSLVNELPESIRFIVPETYALSLGQSKEINGTQYQTVNKTLFIARNGDTIHSGIQSSRMPTLEDFLVMAVGIEPNEELNAKYDDTQQFKIDLFKGLSQIAVQDYPQFWLKRPKKVEQKISIKQLMAVTGIAMIAYFSLTSMWLKGQSMLLDREITAYNEQVESALKSKKQIAQLEDTFKQLQEPLENQSNFWTVWPVVLEVINEQAIITSVAYRNETFDVRFTGNTGVKATKILGEFAQHDKVLSAVFSQPVRSRRGKEQFTIKLKLHNSTQSAI